MLEPIFDGKVEMCLEEFDSSSLGTCPWLGWGGKVALLGSLKDFDDCKDELMQMTGSSYHNPE